MGNWFIEEIELENFRCFDHIKIDLNPSLTVLVGTNGAGKTAILDGIAIMMSTVLREFGGPTRGFTSEDAREVARGLDQRVAVAHMEPQFPVSATMHATLDGHQYWWTRTRASAQGRTTWAEKNSPVGRDMSQFWHDTNDLDASFPALPVIALYGVERLLNIRKETGAIPRTRAGAYESALDGRSDFSRLSTYIRALTIADILAERRGEHASAVKNQLLAITLACNQILQPTGWKDPEWNPVVEALTFSNSESGVLPLSSLSSGTKIAVGVVVDLVSRMARANPYLGAETLLTEVPGVVLLDEVDLHLHPTWQQTILPQLQNIFPRVQFIVTTHSPQVLSTVPAESIRVLRGNDVGRVDYSQGIRSDILMDRVLATNPEPALSVNRELDEYMSIVYRGEGKSASAQALRRFLDDKLGGVANVPKLADADASMAFYDEDWTA